MDEFKNIISKLRIEKNMSQQFLAQELGISKSTVAMWETGKRFPSKELYEQIADLFNVDIDYLFGRTNIRQKIRFDEDGNKYIHDSISELITGTTNPILYDKQILRIMEYYCRLNNTGKNELIKRLEELSALPQYSANIPLQQNSQNMITLDPANTPSIDSAKHIQSQKDNN